MARAPRKTPAKPKTKAADGETAATSDEAGKTPEAAEKKPATRARAKTKPAETADAPPPAPAKADTPAKIAPTKSDQAPPPPRRKAAARKPAGTSSTPKPRAAARPRVDRPTTSGAVQTAGKSVADSAPAQFVADTRERMGDRNFFASVIGGVAAVGAAVAGVLFALQKGQGKSTDAPEPEQKPTTTYPKQD